jgi:hypothetical protein
VRWNSPYINHFTQPDTIIPDQTSPQGWDRYAYVNNNPLRYADPTGHWLCGNTENCLGGGGDISGVTGEGINAGLNPDSVTEVSTAASEGSAWLDEGSIETSVVELNPSEQAYETAGKEYYEANLNRLIDELEQADASSSEADRLRDQIARYATNNFAKDTVSIGNNGAYQRPGYTYFELPDDAWQRLDAMGETDNINLKFMSQQAALEKDFDGVLTGEAGHGTVLERGFLENPESGYRLVEDTPTHFHFGRYQE